MAEVTPQAVSWLWAGRIPFGEITLLDGDAGTRKSTVALYVAVAVTRGFLLPGDSVARAPVNVLLLGEEDDNSRTVRPRLEALGADLNRIVFFENEEITLAGNLASIERVVRERQIRLIIIDPLSGSLGTDSNREQSVRRVLMSLSKLAKRLGFAVLAIRHFTKSRASSQQAGVGSVAIGAVARSGLIMAADPAGSDEMILAHYKGNLGPLAPSLRLRFEGVTFEFAGEINLGPNDLVKPAAYDTRSAVGEAVAFLQEALSQGAVVAARINQLASKAGVGYRTLRKAKDLLGVRSRHSQVFHGPWMWHLPGDERIAPDPATEVHPPPTQGAQDDPVSEGHVGNPEPPGPEPPGPPPFVPPTPPRPSAAPPAQAAPPPPRPEAPTSPKNGTAPGFGRFSFLEID